MKPTSAEPYLKIGDVAKKVGVSPSVIRSWESLGLARPRRTESKYRLYSADDVKLLKRARFLRKVRGLNAAAIVQLLKREGKVRPAARWKRRSHWRASYGNCGHGASFPWHRSRKPSASR